MASLATWVKDLPGLSEEQRTGLLATVNASPEAAAAFEKTIADAGRLPGELQTLETKRQELEADFRRKETAVQELAQTVKGHQGKVSKLYEQALAQASEAQRKLATVTQRVKATADVYGLDAEEILGKEGEVLQQQTQQQQTQQQTQTSEPDPRYVNTEAWSKQAGILIDLPAALLDLNAEHQELFGKPMPAGAATKLLNAVKNGPQDKPINLRTAFDNEFKVADRRAAIEKQSREDEITRRVDEQMKIKTSEMLSGNIPNQNPNIQHPSPVLRFVNGRKAVAPQAIQKNDHIMRAAQHMDAKIPELVS